jgi:two-component system CheB/CheR fusion protein
MLAHELRNPLASIGMTAEMLEKISAAHPQLPNIQKSISRQASHMKGLLEGLLEASRVSSGKVTLHKSLLSLTEVIESAVEISQPFLNENSQQLIVDVPQQPILIEGDAVRLSQVFSNLLSNASKYAPQREPITLSARPGENGTVEISVKDKGGIEPELQPFIFELFMQGPRTLDRSEGGLGIGLSVVRTLVELHGGKVEVHSDGVGHGCEFTVVLPVSHKAFHKAAPPEAGPALPAPTARTCRILLVEDQVDINENLNLCLTYEGHSVTSAFDGPSGLELAKAGGYDIVISDIGLPGMDGFEMLSKLRLLGLAPMPCCIAMTGYDQKQYRARARDAGFDHYLVKPVALAALRKIISDCFTPLAMT